MTHVVVIGAGQAGSSCVAKLRAKGFDGKITLIGAEAVPPYQRPPLSKAYLSGEMSLERLYLRPATYYAEHDIALRLSTQATAIDLAAKRVTLKDGETLAYDHLVLTTGAAPRPLPAAIGGTLDQVFTVRNLADADAMAPALAAGKKALIVGGGYIGLEAAAVAAKHGVHVTLIEMADRILQRVAAPETSAYFRNLHIAHGVDIRESTGLTELIGVDGTVTGAILDDGTQLAVDFVIVGIGIIPGTVLAERAGLACDNGIITNALGQTSDPTIWAAGDCAAVPYGDHHIRIESVGNAIDQAEAVAQNIMGADAPYVPAPWFWSDQYDCKLQIAGLNTGYDAVYVRKGEGGAQSHWYYRKGHLIAVDAMNDPRSYMIGKRLIAAGKSPDPEALTDPATDMKGLLSA